MIQVKFGYKNSGEVIESFKIKNQILQFESDTDFNGFDCDRQDIGAAPAVWPFAVSEENECIFPPNTPDGYFEMSYCEDGEL